VAWGAERRGDLAGDSLRPVDQPAEQQTLVCEIWTKRREKNLQSAGQEVSTTIFPPAEFSSMQRCASAI
jgi:hypothetical protein